MSLSKEKIELKDFDTIFVTGHATVPFSISWSGDGKVAVLVDDGVQIFELYPTPINAQLTITFLRSWIPTNTRLPFQNVLVENKGNSFVWNLKRKEVYEMAMDSTLAPIIEKSAISSYITQCSFSPLISNECYISCLTNNGVLEIYKWDYQRWTSVLDVSDLWIKYCNIRDCSETINYNLFKLKIFQLKIITMSWSEFPKLIFMTGHEDGGICIWDVEVVNKTVTMNVNHYFHIIGKPSYLTMCKTNKPNTYLFLVGTLLGRLKCVPIQFTHDAELELGVETELWKYEDFIKPVFIKGELIQNNLFIFTVKNHIILIQRLEMNEDNSVNIVNTSWHEFPSPVISFDNYLNYYVIGTRNHEFYTLNVNETNFEVEGNIEIPLKPKHSACFHCYGLAISHNKAIWIVASSAKVNFDAKTMKETIHLLVLIPKVKTFKSLSDFSCTGLIRKIIAKYKSTRLTEISDLLELKKCELLADPSNYSDGFSCSISSSPLELKLMIWETRLKIFTQSVEDQNIVSQCESMLALQWCANRKSHYSSMQSKLTPMQRRSLEIMQVFLKERKSVTEGESRCKICGEITPVTDVKFSTCSNSHSFPRCCLSLLPCDTVPYAFCRLCDSTAFLEFKMKFLKGRSDDELDEKLNRNEVRKCDGSNCRDNLSEVKFKMRMRRSKANARERNRMHGLNKALDRLRSALPIKNLRSGIGMKHKLSKIETLKIACNYIRLLMNILKNNEKIDIDNFASSLTVGLSHTTANFVVTSLSQGSTIASEASQDSEFSSCLSQYESISGDWSKNIIL